MSDHGERDREEPLNSADEASGFNNLFSRFQYEADQGNKDKHVDEDAEAVEKMQREKDELDEKHKRAERAKKTLRKAERYKYVIRRLRAHYNSVSVSDDSEEDSSVVADEDELDRSEAGPSRQASRAASHAASKSITTDGIKVHELAVHAAQDFPVLRCGFCGEGENEFKAEHTPVEDALEIYKEVWGDHAWNHHKMKTYDGWQANDLFWHEGQGCQCRLASTTHDRFSKVPPRKDKGTEAEER